MTDKKKIQKLRQEGKTFTEIGRIFNCSRQRIHSICPGPIDPDSILTIKQQKKKAYINYRARLKTQFKRAAYEQTPEGRAEILRKKREKERYKYWKKFVVGKKKITKFKNII